MSGQAAGRALPLPPRPGLLGVGSPCGQRGPGRPGPAAIRPGHPLERACCREDTASRRFGEPAGHKQVLRLLRGFPSLGTSQHTKIRQEPREPCPKLTHRIHAARSDEFLICPVLTMETECYEKITEKLSK